MGSDPKLWISVLRRSQDRLAAVVTPLNTEQLNGPSYDDGWSIAEVLSHLGSQTEIFSMFLDAVLEGRDPPGSEAFQPVWDAWNARSADEQSADSLEANELFVRRLEAFSDEQLDGMRMSLFGMEVDAAGLVRMRLGEHAVHTWDVAVAVDPSAEVAADAVELLIDGLAALIARVGKPAGRAMQIRVRTTGPERDLLLSVGEEVRLVDWAGQEADGVLRIPAAAFLRLVYGRLDEAHMPAVDVDAPNGTLEDLRRVFPGL